MEESLLSVTLTHNRIKIFTEKYTATLATHGDNLIIIINYVLTYIISHYNPAVRITT